MPSSMADAPQTVCIISDPALRRTLRRTLNAVGSSVEFVDSIRDCQSNAAIVFIDHECRLNTTIPELLEVLGDDGKLVILGESIEDDDVVSMLRHDTMNHVIADQDKPDEVELVVTAVKLLSGDIFGLEKYLAWGVKVNEAEINTYDDKRNALESTVFHAQESGARRYVLRRIESVTDELLMNALYDAPAALDGLTPNEHVARRSGKSAHPDEARALLRYACDGRYFAVSVEDRFGELKKQTILDHLLRARQEQGRPQLNSDRGAGLGMCFILASVTRFIVNVTPQRRTEVLCLFDLRQRGRDQSTCTRSLHIFTCQDTGVAA